MALCNLQRETDWVYRQGELVLGPVTASALEALLDRGTLNPRTEVALAGSGAFQPLGQWERFRAAAASAEAKLREMAAARAERKADYRRRMRKLAGAAGVSLVAVGGAAVAARHLAMYASPGAKGGAHISTEPFATRLARSQVGGEALVDRKQETASAPSVGAAPLRPAAGGRRMTLAERARKGGAAETPGGRLEASGEDGLEAGVVDQGAIHAVVAARQSSLFPCVKAAAEAHPDVGGRIPIEFVINHDGRVLQVWVDHNALKQGDLHACLLRELQKWQFPQQPGERPSVSLVFNLSRRS